MQEIPSDNYLLKEIRAISKTAPHLMTCSNCRHYNPANGECVTTHMRFPPFVRGCEGKYYISDEETLLAKVKKELTDQALDLEKIENLLALVITTSCAASIFAEDLAKRIKAIRGMPSHQDKRSELRKDLDMVEEIQHALSRIKAIADIMSSDLYKGIDKIDQQYRLYIERHINRMFSTNGVFDVKKSDDQLNNAMIFCEVLGKFIKGCLGNKENYNKVFALLDNLENDTPYGLTFEDLKHYKLKGYDND